MLLDYKEKLSELYLKNKELSQWAGHLYTPETIQSKLEEFTDYKFKEIVYLRDKNWPIENGHILEEFKYTESSKYFLCKFKEARLAWMWVSKQPLIINININFTPLIKRSKYNYLEVNFRGDEKLALLDYL